VSDEGIYKLTRTLLSDNGVDVNSVTLSQVRLYNLGEETAIHVHDQDTDNAFDADDYILFYGMPADAQYEKYAKYNVYWLTTEGGTGSPKRMSQIDGTVGGAQLAGSHVSTVHYEEDSWYWGLSPGDDSFERWFFYGNPLFIYSGEDKDFTLTLPGVTGQGSLKIHMGGRARMDHEVEVFLNGVYLQTFTWSGIALYEASIPSVNLLAGDNTVTIQCNGDDDAIAIDWFEATYPRDFVVNSNSLRFTHDSGYRYRVEGLTAPGGVSDLLAFDITSRGDVGRVVNFNTLGGGPYDLEFETEPGGGERTYLVLSSDEGAGAVKTPSGISEDSPSSLSEPSNGADYILITHKDIGWDGNGDPEQWLNDLTALRQAQGLRVKVVDVEDVYDEYGYGLATPQAVKDFLTEVYTNWTAPAPRYVLLVGDSTMDPKANGVLLYGADTTPYLPTYLISTEYMETATDEWFVRVSGEDMVSDMYIGRLPARSGAEASVIVNKIITYETSQENTKGWERNMLLLADNEIEDWESAFVTLNEEVAGLLPEGMNEPFRGYLCPPGSAAYECYDSTPALTAYIKERIDAGVLAVNYSGHAGMQRLAVEGIFENWDHPSHRKDVADLANGEKLPFFVSMSCDSGYFLTPESLGTGAESLMEALLRAEEKGAVGAFMPTGRTTTQGQQILDKALFDAIFTQDMRTLGEAVSSAKHTLLANGEAFEDHSTTFLLFADPAMDLKVPLPRRPSGLAAEGQDNVIALQWESAKDSNGADVSGYNLYRSTTAGEGYEKVNTSLISGTEYTDSSVVNGTRYYYVVTSVDGDGDESVKSQEVSAMPLVPRAAGTLGAGSSGGGGGCFISTAAGHLP
jgi:hypothetical protein